MASRLRPTNTTQPMSTTGRAGPRQRFPPPLHETVATRLLTGFARLTPDHLDLHVTFGDGMLTIRNPPAHYRLPALHRHGTCFCRRRSEDVDDDVGTRGRAALHGIDLDVVLALFRGNRQRDRHSSPGVSGLIVRSHHGIGLERD
jgi:hypothetical protein